MRRKSVNRSLAFMDIGEVDSFNLTRRRYFTHSRSVTRQNRSFSGYLITTISLILACAVWYRAGKILDQRQIKAVGGIENTELSESAEPRRFSMKQTGVPEASSFGLLSVFSPREWEVDLAPFRDELAGYGYPERFLYKPDKVSHKGIKKVITSFSREKKKGNFIEFSFSLSGMESYVLRIEPGSAGFIFESSSGQRITVDKTAFDISPEGEIELVLSNSRTVLNVKGKEILSLSGIDLRKGSLSVDTIPGAEEWIKTVEVVEG